MTADLNPSDLIEELRQQLSTYIPGTPEWSRHGLLVRPDALAAARRAAPASPAERQGQVPGKPENLPELLALREALRETSSSVADIALTVHAASTETEGH